MKQAFRGFFIAVGLIFFLSFGAFAQTPDSSFDIDKFRELATRAEGVVSNDQASTQAFEILRSDLVRFRSQALSSQEARARRVSTIQQQIEALGPVPENGQEESAEIAARRTELASQLAAARAPLDVAREAFRRASGLIDEIDKIIRKRNTTTLLQRDNSPVNPVLWPVAISALTKYVQEITSEVRTQFGSKIAIQQRKQNGPIIIFLIALGLIILIPATRWAARRLKAACGLTSKKFGNVLRLLYSLAVFILPSIGLLFLFAALILADIFSLRGDLLIEAIPDIGLSILGANWLAKNLPLCQAGTDDPTGEKVKLLAATQRLIWIMGAIVAAGSLISGLNDGANWSPDIRSVLMFPLVVLLGYCLFRAGRKINKFRGFLGEVDGAMNIPERIAAIFMWACYAAGLGGPLLAALGYSNAGAKLVFSMTLTLALSGAVFFIYILLARFVSPVVVAGDVKTEQERPTGGLYKVALAFALISISIPVFALIWGARVSDISGLWFTLNEGISLGDTRVSISDFLIFILIFFIGYTITRLLQSTLRTIVFPNTRVESGAQNAIVTGFGYVGIFLSALIAITTTGLDLSSLAIVAGALSVGIGFGLQAIVSNFVSGIILLIERPVKIGDWVEIGAYSGSIRKVSVRSTSIETFDGATVIVPNADLIAGTVTNWTHGNVRGRVKVPVGVAYDTDPELVKEVLLSIADDHPMLLKLPKPAVIFMGFGADSMDFQLRGILRDVNYVLSTASDINFEIVKRFRDKGIEIPFAQREVTIKNAQDFLPKAAKPARKPAAKRRAKPKA
jgi:potassium-dependent mechanosensitive channel